MTDNPALTQLILKDTFSSQWEILDPDGAGSRWSFSPEGSLQQTASVGSGKEGSGTFAILKEAISLDAPEVRLLCHPGASFQVGMALCFTDRNNCVLFSLEQQGPAFQGYYVLVTELKNGAATNLLKGFIGQELSPPITLAARQAGEDTVLLLGSERTGLARALRDLADVTLAIPMVGSASSLNVAVAHGIVLHALMTTVTPHA